MKECVCQCERKKDSVCQCERKKERVCVYVCERKIKRDGGTSHSIKDQFYLVLEFSFGKEHFHFKSFQIFDTTNFVEMKKNQFFEKSYIG